MLIQHIPARKFNSKLHAMAVFLALVLVLSCISLSSAHITFAVDDVAPAVAPAPYPAQNLLAALSNKIEVTPEGWFYLPDSLNLVEVGSIPNSFVGTVHAAYAHHYPLVLSPDMIWQCIVQGFAIHVNKNAERLRHLFVEHEGRRYIEVREDSFVKGSPFNDWEHTFEQFSERIRENIGNQTHGLLTPEFTTTGPVERATAQVVMMGAFKEYFDYGVRTLCGIPEITLQGTVEDWRDLREKTLSLARFDLQWWIEDIQPILDEFVRTSSGTINQCFWQSLYKRSGLCGGPFINGWIITLFPYVGTSLHRNTALSTWKASISNDYFSGITTEEFPPGLVSVPFVWHYYALEYNMSFYAGFLGIGQNNVSLALQPLIGWAVADRQVETSTEAPSVNLGGDGGLCLEGPRRGPRNCSTNAQQTTSTSTAATDAHSEGALFSSSKSNNCTHGTELLFVALLFIVH